MTLALLTITLLVLLAALLHVKHLQFHLKVESDEATKSLGLWRHAEHQLAAMTVKTTKLIGERAELNHKIAALETELRRKHRRARV